MNTDKSTASLTFVANTKKKEKSYWLKQLSGQPQKSSFPFDYDGSGSFIYKLETLQFSIPGGIARQLIDLAKGSSARLFVFLITGFFILSRKYTGSRDILLGIPVSRPRQDVELLNSALPIRYFFDDHLSFPQHLSKLGKILIEAENHQNFPVRVLCDLLGLPWSPGDGFPLFDVVVSLENIHHDTLHEFLPNIMVSFKSNPGGIEGIFSYNTGRYGADAITGLIKHYQALLGTLLANPHKKMSDIDLLSKEEKQQILVSFNDTAADFPGSAVVHELIDRQAEQTPHANAVAYKEQRLSYAELKNQTDSLAVELRQRGLGPDQIAAVIIDHIPEMVVALVGILKSGAAYLPIDPDYPPERIDYILQDSNALTVINENFFGGSADDFSKMGAAPPTHTRSDRYRSFEASSQTFAEKTKFQEVLVTKSLCGHGGRRHFYASNHLAYIIYTSGSTGKPKGVMIEHRSFVDFTTWAVVEFEHRVGYQVLLSNSYAFDGSIQQIFPPLISGGTLHLIERELRLDMAQYLDYLKTHRINNIDEVPVLMKELLALFDPNDREEKLADLTCLSLGSEYVPIDLIKKCRQHLNHHGRIINAYGPAEASVETTTYHCDGTSASEQSLIGKPRRNIRVYILDEAGHLCPIGVQGEICISGVGLARGYLNRPELTAEKFDRDLWDCRDYHDENNQKLLQGELKNEGGKCRRVEGEKASSEMRLKASKPCAPTNSNELSGLRHFNASAVGAVHLKKPSVSPQGFIGPPCHGVPGRRRLYKTGDRGCWLPDGNIRFFGRSDDQVKVRGFRVELSEIEKVLKNHEMIKNSIVVPRGDKKGNTEICAYYVIDNSTGNAVDLDLNHLRRYLEQRLPSYMIPSYLVELEKIPVTPNGKVDKKALPEPGISKPKPGASYAAPEDEMEKLIAGAWKEILNTDIIGTHDNFFDLGGNSLKIIQVNNKLSGLLKIKIPVVKFFEYPTISGLSGYLKQQSPGASVRLPGVKDQPVKQELTTSLDTAVIGMAGRFPGAGNTREFWENLKNGIESIWFFSAEELAEEGVSANLLDNRNYVKARGTREDKDRFDAAFFNYAPQAAMIMDPQVRMFHECIWETLEDAGYNPDTYDKTIGLFVGSANNVGWEAKVHLFSANDTIHSVETDQLIDFHFLPTHIAYKLNLKGPAVFVQTACSTSLAAVHMACNALLAGDCVMALAGGVTLFHDKKSGYMYQEGLYMSPDGHTRAFDAKGSGAVGGEGAAAVLLKPLAAANEDRDHIYAVIKASASDNDGSRKVGFSAPSVNGQTRAITAAYRKAGIPTVSITYIETHGTGTKLGDPIELEALRLAFNTQKKGFCAIGSVKTNVGHTDCAAGAVSLIKTVLGLKHKQIPPTLYFETPNIQIDLIDSPFYLNTYLRDWEPGPYPLRAGVNSLGIGGTNVHVILEEYVPGGQETYGKKVPGLPKTFYKENDGGRLILVSAKTPTALEKMKANLAEFLETNKDIPLADVAYTLQKGRKLFDYKWMALCPTIDEAVKALESPGAGEIPGWKEHEENEKRNRVSLPTYPFEGQPYWIEGDPFNIRHLLQAIRGTQLQRKEDIADWFYFPRWIQTPQLPPLKKKSHPICFLVFIGECPLVLELAKRLGAADPASGEKNTVVTVREGNLYEKKGDHDYVINPRSGGDYPRLLNQLKGAGIFPNRVIHFWNVNENDHSREPGFIGTGFYSLFHLAAAIGKQEFAGEIRMDVVTTNIQEITGNEPLNPGKAVVLGPLKVIPQEYPFIICRSIDIQLPAAGTAQEEKLISHLIDEFSRDIDFPDAEIAYRGYYRWIKTYEPGRLESPGQDPVQLKHRGVYLITGGNGSIGYTLASYLARHVQARLILTGLTPIPAREEWDHWLQTHKHEKDDRVSGKIEKIRRLEELGGEVLVFTADAAEKEAMEKAIKKAEETFGPINGVIHAAGITRGKSVECPIEETTRAECHLQFKPKIQGTLVLAEIFKNKTLDFCILISSLSEILGGLGFGAYSAANAFLDVFAYQANRTGAIRWISVNWEGWLFNHERENMTHHSLEKTGETGEAREMGITPDEGAETFKRILGLLPIGTNQVIVSSGDLQARIERWVKLRSLRKNETPGTPGPSSIQLQARPQLPTRYAAPHTPVEKAIAETWKKQLGYQQIGIYDDFFQLGGDSLKAITLISKIHKDMNARVTLREFFTRPTIEGLAGYISGAKKGEFAPIVPAEKKEYYNMSSTQRRLYTIGMMAHAGTGYNLTFINRLVGKLDRERLEDIFRILIKRHESFRTSFLLVSDKPVQRIHEEMEFEIEEKVLGGPGTLFQKGSWPPEAIINSFVRPFDLAKAPLMRVGLLKLEEEEHILVMDVHHIIYDGVSQHVFFDEFTGLYNRQPLPPIRLQYKDYSQWLDSPGQEDAIKKQETYWLNVLSGELPVLEIPTDYTRPKVQSFEGGVFYMEMAEKEVAALKDIARSEGGTLFMLLLGLLNVFFSRISGQEDILLGVATAGRGHDDLGQIIGMFVNTLVMRNYPAAGKPFRQFSREVKQRTLEAFENQDYPFENLVEKLVKEKDFSRNPLFDVMFVLQDVYGNSGESTGPAQSIEAGEELKLEDIRPDHRASQFDLALEVVESGGKLSFSFEYCSKLFRKETIECFAGYFKRAAGAVIENPCIRICDIEMISAEEKKKILVDFNAVTREYPDDRTIHELFREQVEQTPERVALSGMPTLDDNVGPVGPVRQVRPLRLVQLTYREFNEQSDRLAGLLIEKGVQPDSIVGIMMERSIEMLIGILAILKAGGAYLPIEINYPEERIKFMLKDSGAGVLVTTPKLQVKVKTEVEEKSRQSGLPLQFIHINTNLAFSSEPSLLTLTSTLTCQVSPANLAYIIYTSGTTGKPKGVMANHYNVTRVVKNTNYIDIKEQDRILQLSNYAFDGSVFDIYGALLNGAALVLVRQEQILAADQLAALIKREQVTVFFVTTALFNTLVEIGIDSFARVKKVLFGGENVSVEHTRQALQYMGKGRILHVYGPTETTVFASYYFIDAIDETAVTIPIGRPLSGTAIYILSQDMKVASLGVSGEVYIGGKGTARGYLNCPDLTAEKFVKNPFVKRDILYRSGDLARWLPRGTVEFLGRIDQQIKIRGFRIELGEIENRLLKHPRIKESVVLAQEEKKGDKYLCAYIVPDGEHEIPGLREYLAKELPEYMIPSYFVPIEKIPLTANGKIDQKVLPKPELKIGENYTAPGNEIEKKLVELWSEILGRDPLHATQLQKTIGIDDNFFRLGGHSLKTTILSARIEQAFNVKIPLAEIFVNPRIRELSKYIREAAPLEYKRVAAVEKKEFYLLSSAQKRLYFLQQLDLNSTGYNITMALSLGKDIKKDQLELVFKQLIARHESLRTSFSGVNEEVVQRIHPVEDIEFSLDYDETAETGIEEIMNSFIRPFDLSQAPLIRSLLIKHPDGYYAWMVDVHHIVSDGTSHAILTEDFMALYSGKALKPLPIHYKDFALWQNRLLASGGIKNQQDYWLGVYAGEIPRLNPHTDYKRPGVFTFEGARCVFNLDRDEAVKFKGLGVRCGGTLYMNMLTVLNTLFYKYTGQSDIIIGSGIAGRRHADIQGVVGMFVNTLAMRNFPTGEKSYELFLREVIANSVKAFENQDVQFEELVEILEPERDPSRNPLFDISMVVQNFRGSSSAETTEIVPLADQSVPAMDYTHQTSKFDMTFFIHEIAGGIQIDIEYYTGIFKQETILRLISHFKNAIRAVTAQPSLKLKDIGIMSEEEKRQALYEFNNTAVRYPNHQTIHELYEEQASKEPHRIALVYEEQSVSFRELDRKANQLAYYLQQGKHLQPEALVGVLLDRSPEQIIAILGVLKAGGAYLPLDYSLPEARIKNMIDDTQLAVVLSTGRFIRILNKLQWECKSFNTFLCLDSSAVYQEEEAEKSGLMEENLWNYVANSATDEITGGGWYNSYTGEAFSSMEMAEYGDNILKKLTPLLHGKMEILEIGCGSGISMYRIAPKVGSYHATDLSRGIIENNRKKVLDEGHRNIFLTRLAAHEIDRLERRNFDMVIINSVIQSFHGLNYLRKVIVKSIDMLAENGYLFIGDILDQDLKETIIKEMMEFKYNDPRANSKTKTDWSADLFVARAFFEDLRRDIPAVERIEFSDKIYSIENELTRFRYDALITVNKHKTAANTGKGKLKHQEDRSALTQFPTRKILAGIQSGNPAYVIYTSGSTGKPKGVVVEHGNVIRLVKNSNYIHQMEFTGSDRFLVTGAFAFDISTFEIWGMLLNGMRIYLADKSVILDMEKLKETIDKEQISMVHFTPQLYQEIVRHCPAILERIRCLLVGGDMVAPAPVNQSRKSFRHLKILHMYGPTENTTFSTFFPIEKEYEARIPIGKPISNSTAYILDSYGGLQPVGVPGELCTGGAGIARGYLNRPELTAEKFDHDLWDLQDYHDGNHRSYRSHQSYIYKTGDLARWLKDGNIEFLGRIDSQVKIRGYRIEMQEIENRLLKAEGVKEAVVIDWEEASGDKYLCAYVVIEEKEQLAGFRDFLSKDLPEYMIPSYFISMSAIPLNPNGKVDRKALPDPEAAVIDGGAYSPPRDEIENKLVKVWHDVLSKPHQIIGIDDNFFQSGGHSLKAAILAAKIHKEFEVKVPLAEVFRSPTIKGLAAYIRTAGKVRYTAIEPVEKREYYEISHAQTRLWILNRVEKDLVAYNMPDRLPMENLNRRALEKAVETLIRRHEILRTTFITSAGEPGQKIHAYEDLDFSILYFDIRNEENKEAVIDTFQEAESSTPFNLETGPLLRTKLFRVDDNRCQFLYTLHHIISDGWSMDIVAKEFMDLYSAYDSGKDNPLTPPRIQYKDYTRWHLEQLTGENLKKHQSYWHNRFKGRIPRLELPTDYPRAELRSFAGEFILFSINKEITAQLKRISKEFGTTLFITLLSVVNVFLYRYTGQTDIIVGTLAAGREHKDLENQIGFYVNMLPLRNRLQRRQSFVQVLQMVNDSTLEALEHQVYPFDRLVHELKAAKDMSRSPLVDVVVGFVDAGSQPGNTNNPDFQETDSRGDLLESGTEASKHDMRLRFSDQGNRVMVQFRYNPQLFKKERIIGMKKRFIGLVTDIVANVDKEIHDLHFALDTGKKMPGKKFSGGL